VRYNDAHQRPKLEAVLRETCEKAATELGARFTLTFSGTGDVFVTEAGPLVETMKVAVQETTGHTPKLSTTGGTSDARFIKDHCPVIELGLLNATIHQVDERVPVADLETLTKIYERFITLFFAQA
jgi:succinyl-diaminopimelate desuccinylase